MYRIGPLNLSRLVLSLPLLRDSTQATEDGEAANDVLVLFAALAVCALAALAVGYQVTIIQARERGSDGELAW